MQTLLSLKCLNYNCLIKAVIGIITITIIFLIYSLLAFLTGSHIITIIILLLIFIKLAHTLGTALMFPASFRFFKGGVQISYGNQLINQILTIIRNLNQFNNSYINGQPIDNAYHAQQIQIILKFFIEMYGKFQNSNQLSPKKLGFLKLLKQTYDIYNSQDAPFMSLRQCFSGLEQTETLKKPNLGSIYKLKQYSEQIHLYLHSFIPEKSFFKNLQFTTYGEKIYEINFQYFKYDNKYDYKKFHCITKDKQTLEGVIIYKLLNHNSNVMSNDQTIIFCNPNGCMLQTFPFQCSYIDFYLQKGYHVCMWNYRGYGNSTGSPSLSKNQKDSQLIYQYCIKQGLNPTLVHGYSIGGPVAIYLASVKPINCLIVDRTFFCLDEMAKDYGKFLTFMMKIIFYKDRKDYAKVYLHLQAKKLIIYDPYDQIIKNCSSMKHGVSKHFTEQLAQPEQNLQNEQTTNLFLKVCLQIKQFAQNSESKYIGYINKVFVQQYMNALLKSKVTQNHKTYFLRKPHLTLEEAEILISQETQNEFLNEKIVQTDQQISNIVVEQLNFILQNLDSAGLQNLAGDYKYINSIKPENIYEQVCSFIFGLITFGSYFQLELQKLDQTSARVNCIIKMAVILKQLKRLQQRCQEQQFNYKHIRKFRQMIGKIAMFVTSNLNNQLYKKVGILLPVSCGHNGSLNYQQFQFLGKFIQKTQINQNIELNL